MSNPFEPPKLVVVRRTDKTRSPWLLAAIVTICLIPIWFVILAMIAERNKLFEDSDIVTIHLGFSFLCAIFIVPLNAFFVAPALANLAFPKNSITLVVHFLVMLSTVAVCAAGYYLARQESLFSIQMAVILIPPLLAGSLVYSFRFNAINVVRRRHRTGPISLTFDEPVLGTFQFEVGLGWRKFIDFGEGFVDIVIGSEGRPPSKAMLKTVKKWATDWPIERPRLLEFVQQQLAIKKFGIAFPVPQAIVLVSIRVLRSDYPKSCLLLLGDANDKNRFWQLIMVGQTPRSLRPN